VSRKEPPLAAALAAAAGAYIGADLVAGGVADAHVQAELGGRRGQRVAGVGGVTDVGEGDAVELAGVFQKR